MYVVTVLFKITEHNADAFEAAMLENAKASLELEPGCQQFDVCKGAGGEIFLYEIYDDRAAFEAHLGAAHFKAFDAKVAPWVSDKQVWIYEKLS